MSDPATPTSDLELEPSPESELAQEPAAPVKLLVLPAPIFFTDLIEVPEKLGDEEIDALVAYLQQLGTLLKARR